MVISERVILDRDFMAYNFNKRETKDHIKTDRVLILFFKLTQAPGLRLSEKEVKEILDVSKAQYYKLIKSLTSDVGERKAIMVKVKEEGKSYFVFNKNDWKDFLDATASVDFILEGHRQLGHLFPRLDANLDYSDNSTLKRKFHYLYQSKTKNADDEISKLKLELIIKALTANRKLIIQYDGKNESATIFPLTLVQYKDDLYLACTKNTLEMKNLRTYKISRIDNVYESKESFKYPAISKWDPKEYWKHSCDLKIADNLRECEIKVFGRAKKVLSEKNFYSSKLIKQTDEFDHYQCLFSNITKFVGFLFTYADEVEILNKEVREVFIKKGQDALLINKNS